ncbi:hypothetical protein TSOC_009956 [Tetrabaena socialis]|uniref:Uncharacterized protein n=1 Tax=Tetrabaena socialis TaxID=47790 RepID=A0A2J7ZUJ3_9CHLO|nr:hypothetical protein TSOC_009956 [Tetrabaena socialis]|eukprot:PNH03918.1 hypothetical protein TSOC_009956 [Tetrabaena socialis]
MATSEVAQELYTELECEVYHELEEFIGDPQFVAALERPCKAPGKDGLLAQATGWASGSGGGPMPMQPPQPAGQPTADPPAAGAAAPAGSAASERAAPPRHWARPSGPDAEFGFVGNISRDGTISLHAPAMVSYTYRNPQALYIAACIIDLPEAQALTPKQLQAALLDALKCLKRSRFRQALSWGGFVYRWTAYTASVLQMYQNPWLMRALLTALWATSRVSMRLLL